MAGSKGKPEATLVSESDSREVRTVESGDTAAPPLGSSYPPSLPPQSRASGALSTRYQLVAEVGRGGMGAVHCVFDPSLRRSVAMKVLAPELEQDAFSVLRFELEAQITGQLAHPNVVPVHELGIEPGGSRRYFLMKLVDGETLTSVIHAGELLPWHSGTLDELLGVFLKICDAVAFAHSRGVVHRDLKPDNVMLGSFGQVYVMDWGLAVLRPSHASVGEPLDVAKGTAAQIECVACTPAYMAPEQASADLSRLDARTDVFLLGGILYEMLTRQPPRESQARRPNALSALDPVTPPEAIHPTAFLPVALCRIAMRALEIAPADRYQDVLSLRADVERFMRGADRFALRTYQPGERIVTEGEAGDEAFIITAGFCVAYKTIEGRRRVLREMGPGDVFGETAVLTRGARTASVEAVDALRVMVITRDSFGDELGGNPWLAAFVRTLAERFRETDERCTALQRALDERR